MDIAVDGTLLHKKRRQVAMVMAAGIVAPQLPSEPDYWRAPTWADRIVFICGCGHSRTTIAARILGAHPLIFAAPYNSAAFLGPSPWSALQRLRGELAASGKRILVEKTPRHVGHLARIRQAIPTARFIITVRDGRDVATSLARRYHGNFARGFQRWIHDTAIAAAEQHAPDVLVFRYEDLVTEPVVTASKLCDFVNVKFDPVVLDYHKRPIVWDGQDGGRKAPGTPVSEHRALRAWQVNQPIFDGRGRWKDELPAEIAGLFSTGVAGSLMTTFGYL